MIIHELIVDYCTVISQYFRNKLNTLATLPPNVAYKKAAF